jgi:transposase
MSNEDQEPARRGARPEGQVRRPRLTGAERDKRRADVAQDYEGGASIRDVAAEYGLSFGLTYTLLHEAKVTLRSRTRRPRKAAR